MRRRTFLKLTASAAATAPFTFATEEKFLVSGHPRSAEVGMTILRNGGNAIDAIVASAFAACILSPNNCGIGGYGGHMVIALQGGRKVTAIDFNTIAPGVATPEMFSGKDQSNQFGWRASGVPGTLAGLQMALNRYGTKPLRELLAPAIRLADQGFEIPAGVAGALRCVAPRLKQDSASERLYFKNGEPLKEGDLLRNPDLAAMLRQLADEGTVQSFYRGEIARRIAHEFQNHDGLVTLEDLTSYNARETRPLRLDWNGFTICTAPLPAGGLSVLQALSILKEVRWKPGQSHALIESLRLAWRDRLAELGDPARIPDPTIRLLSTNHITTLAAEARSAISNKKALEIKSTPRNQGGTIHLNAVDAKGNAVALTLTHGNAFGACVTVQGLGLTLGHGMSRFDTDPKHPNAPAHRKRPLTNMCPTIVLREGKTIAALGATGGRLIPNAIYNILANYIGAQTTMQQAIAAPRPGTDGGLDLSLEKNWPTEDIAHLQQLGFKTKTAPSANAHAIAINPNDPTAHSR